MRYTVNMPLRQLAGRRYGRWTVISEVLPRDPKCRRWECRCDCGVVKSVSQGSLEHGGTQSCGCLSREMASARATHGTTRGGNRHGSPEYRIWCGMRSRCNNPAYPEYHLYGGRGIRICPDWDDFLQFLEDMGPRPSPKHSVDRVNNDGPYSKDNCRWATLAEQQNNRRGNHVLTFRGESHTLAQWARITGIHPHTLQRRIENGWPPERALTEPTRSWAPGRSKST